MSRDEFIQNISDRYARGLDLIRAKNNDYANGTNPFRNFELAEHLGIDVKKAIVVRMADKMARIANLLDKEGAVKDESIEDTILDGINYLAILGARIDYEKTLKKELK